MRQTYAVNASSAVAIIFLTFSVILAVTLVSFLAGSVLRRGVCDSLKHPRDSQVIDYIDTYFNINKQYEQIRSQNTRSKWKLQANARAEPLRIAEVIESCSKNNSVYEVGLTGTFSFLSDVSRIKFRFQVLKLSNFYDIQEIRQFPEDYGITRELNALKEKIEIKKVDILSPTAKKNIEELRDSRLNDFMAYKFIDHVRNSRLTSMAQVSQLFHVLAHREYYSEQSERHCSQAAGRGQPDSAG